jgi:hypothetical protein
MLGHTNIHTSQIYARVTEKKIDHEMTSFAESIRQLDSKLYSFSGEEETNLDSIFNNLK